MISRRKILTALGAATAVVTLSSGVAQAQAVGRPVTPETPPSTGNAQGVPQDDFAQMMRWMAFEGATIVSLPASRDALIRELTGAVDLGYFIHTRHTYPRGAGLDTLHTYHITPLGRAVGHRLNLGGVRGDQFMATVGERLAVTSEEGDSLLNAAARGEVRPSADSYGVVVWEPTPYGAMISGAAR